MFNLSQKNWSSRQATVASWALLACLVAGVGCGGMDEEIDSPVETQQQSIEMYQDSVEPASTKPGLGESGDDIQAKSNWNLNGHSLAGGQSMNVSWTAHPGDSFDLCWKKVSDSGTVCGNNEVEIIAGGSDYYSGTQYAGFPTECGGVEYKIRVKRNLFSFRTIKVTTSACNTANACPYGGWFDGANCQIGQAPSGTSAFIYNNAFYYTYASGATKCPLAGSHDDGANCFVQGFSSNVNPFIYQNHWYYAAYP